MPAMIFICRGKRNIHQQSFKRSEFVSQRYAAVDMEINHLCENLRPFNGFKQQFKLTLIWPLNERAWVTERLFDDYFTVSFTPAIEKYRS